MPIVLQRDGMHPFSSPAGPLPSSMEPAGRLASWQPLCWGYFRDFNRPPGAADSLGLLKNVRAQQSPREGVKRKGKRVGGEEGEEIWSSIAREWLVESLLQSYPPARAIFPSASSLLSVSALPWCSEAWTREHPQLAGLEGIFSSLLWRWREKRSWTLKSLRGGGDGERKKQLLKAASLPSQPLMLVGQSSRNSWPGTWKQQSKRVGREKWRKPCSVSLPGKNIKPLKIKAVGKGGLRGPRWGGCTYVACTVPGRRATSILYLAPVSSLMVRFWPKRCPSTLKYTAPSLGWILRATLIFTRLGMSTIARLRGLRPSRPLRGRRPAEETETARERKGRREEEEEGLPDPSQPSPSQKQQMIYLFFPPPLITAQHLYCGSSLHLPVWGTFAAAQIDAGFQGVNPASVMAALIPPSFPGRAGQGRAVQHHGRGQQRSSQRCNRVRFLLASSVTALSQHSYYRRKKTQPDNSNNKRQTKNHNVPFL